MSILLRFSKPNVVRSPSANNESAVGQLVCPVFGVTSIDPNKTGDARRQDMKDEAARLFRLAASDCRRPHRMVGR